jgi:6-pyruvoyl-tetrahydropterin synthase
LVFFREVSYFLTLKGRNAVKRSDFYKLKVKISGEVSKLSGMVINLKKVDLALAQVQNNVTEAANVAQALKSISVFLKNKLDAEVVEIEISRGSKSMVLNSSGFFKKWRSYVLIQNSDTITSKKCQFVFQGKKPDLLSKPWKSTKDFIKSVESSSSQIRQVWIHDEKINGFEIYSL